MEKNVKMLFYGYGNSHKQDEGIGIACAQCLDHWVKTENIQLSVQVANNSHLNVEDVELMMDKDIVVFIDSSKENISDFYLSKVVPTTSETVSPGLLMEMCRKMYNRTPLVFILHIKGYKWNDEQPVTQKANSNLCKALDFLKEKIQHPDVLIHAQEAYCSIDLIK